MSKISAHFPTDVEVGTVRQDAIVKVKDQEALEEDAILRSGLTITFQDLQYTVVNSANKRERINLLTNVSGALLPGKMTALMGPSGSGKSTLLDVLAGRKTVGEVRGSMLFGGQPPSRAFLRRYAGYVEQFDTLLDNLTVAEMLMYTAEMKRPSAEPFNSKKQHVDGVIKQLGLETCRGVRIGNALARGISGGQAKRTNIGLALVSDPRVLFLDEPTSGLDSYTSNEVMTVVKALVHGNITICATIHSPTPYCFGLFDRMLLLLRGRLVYYGQNGPAVLQYFEQQCPSAPRLGSASGTDSAAEWIVDLTTKADREGRWAELADAYAASPLAAANAGEVVGLARGGSVLSQATLDALAVKRGTTTSWCWGLRTLIKYRMTRDFRDPAFLGPRIADKLLVSLVMLTLYWGLGDNLSSINVGNVGAVLFMWSILPGYAAMAYMPAIVLERPLFVRESNDGLYRPITYLSAKILEEVLLALMIALPVSAAVFYLIQLQGQWILFFLVYYLTVSIGVSLAYFVGAMSPNMDVANAALPAYVTILLFFVGMLIRKEDVPGYWSWFQYIDFLKYGWGALMVNQYASHPVPIYGGIETLKFYSLDGVSKWAYLGYQSLFFVGFFALAWAALAFKRHTRR